MLRHREDPQRFVSYYEGQVGGSLPGFYGAPVMYGRGIGSIFSKLFRFVAPLLKKGFAVAKPHLKTAATNIASDAVSRVMGKLTEQKNQEGSGGIAVLSRRTRRRPPGKRVSSSKKRTKRRGGKSVGSGKAKRRKSAQNSDIF